MKRPKKTAQPWELPIKPDARGRLITDQNDPRYGRIIPVADMSWLNCPECNRAPCDCSPTNQEATQ